MRFVCFLMVLSVLIVRSGWAQDTPGTQAPKGHLRAATLHTSGLPARYMHRANSHLSAQQYGQAAAEIAKVESMLRWTQKISPDSFDRSRLQKAADNLAKIEEHLTSGAKSIDIRTLRSSFSLACYALASNHVKHTFATFTAGEGDLAAHHLESAVLHLELGIAYSDGTATDALRDQIDQSRKLSSALISGGQPERFKEDVAKLSAEIDKLEKAQELELKAERDKEQSKKKSRSRAKTRS